VGGEQNLSLVSFVRVKNPDNRTLKEAIKESLDKIEFDFDRKVGKLVIKPNMCYYYHPSTGDVTDPLFVSALIDVLRENFPGNHEILIAEADASAMKCRYSFGILGYDKIADEKGIKLVNLSEEKSRTVEVKINGLDFQFHIPEIFSDSNFVVNVPKIKYMSGSRISCALKNMFGCNAHARKSVYHVALHEAIVVMNKLVRTDLVVVDGLFVVGRSTKQLNLVMASKDPVAVDVAASKMLGINPQRVQQIVSASKEGIGKMDFRPVGDFDYFRKAFPKRTFKDNARAKAASIYLRVLKGE